MCNHSKGMLQLKEEQWKESFDAVLVDAPCSGLGILQKKLDMRWRKEESQITRIANVTGNKYCKMLVPM